MANIYDQHKAAFANVAAYVITDAKGERVATIAFKYPRDGAGRLYAYVHWFGVAMARGFASGGGYDKHSAAVQAAVSQMQDGLEVNRWERADVEQYDAFRNACLKDDGFYWHHHLRVAGFNVLQAV